MRVTRHDRAAVVAYLREHPRYSAEEYYIEAGEVMARIDYDKRPDARLDRSSLYHHVGTVRDVVTEQHMGRVAA